MKKNLSKVMIVPVVAWLAGMILLYPILHWRGLIGMFLVIFSYKLDNIYKKCEYFK